MRTKICPLHFSGRVLSFWKGQWVGKGTYGIYELNNTIRTLDFYSKEVEKFNQQNRQFYPAVQVFLGSRNFTEFSNSKKGFDARIVDKIGQFTLSSNSSYKRPNCARRKRELMTNASEWVAQWEIRKENFKVIHHQLCRFLALEKFIRFSELLWHKLISVVN